MDLRITFTVPENVDPLPIYEDEAGFSVIEYDEPHLSSDGKTLFAPVPVVLAEGPIWTDAAGVARDAVPVVIEEA